MLQTITSGVVVVSRWVIRDCLVARARFYTSEPICDARPIFPKTGEPKPINALDVGRKFGICQRVCVGGKPCSLSELYLHIGHGLLEHLDVIPKKWRLDTFLD